MEWITLIIAGVVAIATIVYVCLTYKILKETRRSIEETDRPEVVIFLIFEDGTPPESHSNTEYYCKLSLCVRNFGTRTARKVRFKGDFSFQPPKGISLDTIDFIDKGIEILPPGIDVIQRVSHSDYFYNIYDHDYYHDKSSKIDIHVEYQSFGGILYYDLFPVDFLNFLGKQPKLTSNE
ncbi:hypothetical protein C6497_17230 [Candidatus Poribacteria bacterium]|nr:MAG: hypothetical protein C6497_17230 [Candidatus Poribacteria bacterium]